MNNLVSSSLLNNIVETMLKIIVGSTMLLAHNNVVQVPISCLGILHTCNLWILLRKICSGSACYAIAPLHKQLVSHCLSTLSSQSERALYGGQIKQSVGCRQRSRFLPCRDLCQQGRLFACKRIRPQDSRQQNRRYGIVLRKERRKI